MTLRNLAFALLALLVPHPGFTADAVPRQDAYAWQFPLHVQQSGEFLEAEIPLEVYRSVSDPDLHDLGVYNATGHAVPRMLERPKKPAKRAESATPLGMVPLYGEIAESGRRLRLLMQLDEPGATVQFDSGLPEADDPELRLRAVIVDLREREDGIGALEFTWSGAPNGFIGTVAVEQGDDLAVWRHLATGTLAELEYEGTRIEQNRIDLSAHAGDYLRVTWSGMPAAWRPESVTAIHTDRAAEAERTWLTLDPIEQSADGRTFAFDIGGYPPVDRIDLELPGSNAVVRAAVEFRHSEQSGWRRSHEGLFYRIAHIDSEIHSNPAPSAPARAAQWRVHLLSGQVEGTVRLRLGWQAERLLFLAQGDAPWTLATGRAQDRVEQFPQQRLLGDRSLFSMLERSGEPGRASVGVREVGAGAVVMEGARTWTWRTVLVWIGLFVAVGFVGYLVWSLMREGK